MTTNRVYLDVDGVLNSLSSTHPTEAESGWSSDSWRLEKINGYWIRWSTELVDSLNTLVSEGVEIRWLTTWCEFAQTMIAPALGLKGGESWKLAGDVKQEDHDWYRVGRSWWKTGVFDADMSKEPADRVAWIDDDHLIYRPWHIPGIGDMVESGALAIYSPSSLVGISREEITQIRDHFELS